MSNLSKKYFLLLIFCASNFLFAQNNAHNLDNESSDIRTKDIQKMQDLDDKMHTSAKYMQFKNWNKWYVLPEYHSFSRPYGNNKNDEFKAQISFGIEILKDTICEFCSFEFGYTQKIYFQLYNRIDSAPFRDVDYNPEFLFTYKKPLDFKYGRINFLALGYNHISNGEREYKIIEDSRNITRSKALDRFIFNINYNYENFNVIFRTWAFMGIFSDGDIDNGDINKYIGYGDIKLSYTYKRNLFELYIGNILNTYKHYKDGYKGNIMFEYSFKLTPKFALYVQYLYGYGDSLYEYNLKVNRLGVGISLVDF